MNVHDKVASMIASGDCEGALRMSGAVLRHNFSDVTAWYQTALAMQGLGEVDVAMKNLSNAVLGIAGTGRPILALSLIKEIEALGGDTEKLARDIAKLYSSEGGRLREAEMTPPPLPPAEAVEPLDGDLGALKEMAKEAMAVAWGESLADSENTPLPFVPLLSALSPEDFSVMVAAYLLKTYAEGETIIEQGTPGDAMYLIVEGQVSVTLIPSAGLESVELAKLGPGAFLGEMGLVSRAPRAASVVALKRTSVLFINRDTLETLASENSKVVDVLVAFCHARMLENLMRISPVLTPIPVLRRPDVISLFNTDYVNANEVVIQEGERPRGLFLIVSGGVVISKREGDDDVVLARLGPGDVFGEISIIMNKTSTATVLTSEDTALLYLPADDFHRVTEEFPGLLKGAFDIAREREAKNNSILASNTATADDLILL